MPDSKLSYDELMEEISRARKLLSELEAAAKKNKEKKAEVKAEIEREQHLMIDNLEAVYEDTEHNATNLQTFAKLAASELKALVEKMHNKMHH